MSDGYDLVMINIGGKGHLNDANELRNMALGPAMTHEKYPEARIALVMDGYDDDPRELWEIPEATEYVRRYAEAAGLRDWRGALFAALDDVSIGLLIACKAIDEGCPIQVVDVGGRPIAGA